MAKKGGADFLSLSYGKQGKQRMALFLSTYNKARVSGRSTPTKGLDSEELHTLPP